MRVVTNKEQKQIAGSQVGRIYLEDKKYSSAFYVTGDSNYEFLGYTHYNDKVVNRYGQVVFQGNQGTFRGGLKTHCTVVPYPTELDGVMYFYDEYNR